MTLAARREICKLYRIVFITQQIPNLRYILPGTRNEINVTRSNLIVIKNY